MIASSETQLILVSLRLSRELRCRGVVPPSIKPSHACDNAGLSAHPGHREAVRCVGVVRRRWSVAAEAGVRCFLRPSYLTMAWCHICCTDTGRRACKSGTHSTPGHHSNSVPFAAQERQLSKSPAIVVATPGRLWDLMQNGAGKSS